MRLPLLFRPTAEAEFEGAAQWYASQQPGLGEDFVRRVQEVLDVITEHPHRYPIAEQDIHEALVPRFPYCIYYRVRPSRIIILAIFHTSRDPSTWQRRR